MTRNRAVVYQSPGHVVVSEVDYPRLVLSDGPGVPKENSGRKCPHGMIVRTLATNICGSDLHIYRGREEPPTGLILGHEITGEVVEVGRDVETLSIGDIVSIPFTVSCGRCGACRRGSTSSCQRVNPNGAGSAYGCVGLGGWRGGQAEFVMVPYADWNALRLPGIERFPERLLDFAMLSDIFPAGFHGCQLARVRPGCSVYIAGAGAVGLAAATSAFLLGAASVIVGDLNSDRRALANAMGCMTIDVGAGNVVDQLETLLGRREVDCAIDAVGFEARRIEGGMETEAPAAVINTLIDLIRPAGSIALIGLYVTRDIFAGNAKARHGKLTVDIGEAWAKSAEIRCGSTPVGRYNEPLIAAILAGRAPIATNVNALPIGLDDAPHAYAELNGGAAVKYVLDPTGILRAKDQS